MNFFSVFSILLSCKRNLRPERMDKKESKPCFHAQTSLNQLKKLRPANLHRLVYFLVFNRDHDRWTPQKKKMSRKC